MYSVLFEVTESESIKESGGWLVITQTIEEVFKMHQSAQSIYGVTDNPFLIRDQCLQYIRALMTLVMAILDSFELDDRVREYELLDKTTFDDLLLHIQRTITEKEDAELLRLTEIYLQSKEAAQMEMRNMALGMAERDLEYLKDTLIQNGHIEYFSNILQNMATFPDDALSAVSCM